MSPWLQTASGAAYDLLNPDPQSITLGDTAHALARICRYTGHVSRFYSVAQHCVQGARALRSRGEHVGIQRAFLLHDAHEAVTGDVASPIKRCLGETWRSFERTHEIAFRTRFVVPRDMPEAIKAMDLAMLETERRALLGPSPRPLGDGWPVVEPVEDLVIYPWIPAVAEAEFLIEAARLEVV